MLEYLLLHDNDIARRCQPQLDITIDDFNFKLEGRTLVETSFGHVAIHNLPVICVAIRNVSPRNAFRYFLGSDDQEYYLYEFSDEAYVNGAWPTDLTPYERGT